MTLRAKLGLTGAVLTLVAALLVPFVLYGSISKGVVALGLHVDETYSGGPKVRTIQQGAYTIDVHRVVAPHMLQSEKPFVQLDWTPVSALPSQVTDAVDVDGDGRPDLRVSFTVLQDPKAVLHADVESLNPRFESVKNVEKEKYSRLIVRVDNTILVRVPLAKH
jgi:hypothetical protein